MPATAVSLETLAHMKNQALVQELARAPENQLVQNEFITRYTPYIRRTVTQAVYALSKMSYSFQMRGMIDDIVNEIFYRLFRNNCRVLVGAELRYESSIYAYLRAMSQNMVRNYLRDYFSHEPLAHTRLMADWSVEGPETSLIECMPEEHTNSTQTMLPEVCKFAEAVWRKQASFTQQTNRNLLIFKLHFIYGYHYDEIARIKGLGLGESGVGNTIARLKHRLQNAAVIRKKLLH